MTEQEALEKYKSKWWVGKSHKEIIDFQLFEEKLCMPFSLFHEAVEAVLERPVYTIEFANAEKLQSEVRG